MILKPESASINYDRLVRFVFAVCREYLTGFRKRKKLRKAKAKVEKAKQEKQHRKDFQVKVCKKLNFSKPHKEHPI